MEANHVTLSSRMNFAIGRENSDEAIKLIRKLRWIGKEEEARSLEYQLNLLPAMMRGSVLAEPISTD
jgi:hypothetical protein